MALIKRLIGSFFRGKINRLEMAFAAAAAPFYAEIKSVERSAADFEKRVKAGLAEWVETTDDGDHYDYGAELGERRDDAHDALFTLRKAFTFLIYHQWERTSQRWSNKKSPNHDDLVRGLKAQTISIDESGLEMLRLLVNTLKHNSATCGPALYASRSDLFARDFNPTAPSPVTGKPVTTVDWAENIRLTDENIEEFFEIVAASVPR